MPSLLKSIFAAAVSAPLLLAAALLSPAGAQEVTLRIHHFLPPPAPVPANFIAPWAEKVTKASGGRIAFEIYPTMQLGGKPPAPYDQARDDVVAIIWTLPRYTPGLLPGTQAFDTAFQPPTPDANS